MGEIYHVYNRSIAEFTIFNNDFEYQRMINAIRYYQYKKPEIKFSRFLKIKDDDVKARYLSSKGNKRVEIITYCVMPTHIHLVINQLIGKGIATFTNDLLNSYTRYFNLRHKRKGPLWESRTKKVLVKSDEQLLHLTRYIHLNPVTAHLVDKPEEWPFSSYCEYISDIRDKEKICVYEDIMPINPVLYRAFVEEGIAYQRELAKIKKAYHNQSSTA